MAFKHILALTLVALVVADSVMDPNSYLPPAQPQLTKETPKADADATPLEDMHKNNPARTPLGGNTIGDTLNTHKQQPAEQNPPESLGKELTQKEENDVILWNKEPPHLETPRKEFIIQPIKQVDVTSEVLNKPLVETTTPTQQSETPKTAETPIAEDTFKTPETPKIPQPPKAQETTDNNPSSENKDKGIRDKQPIDKKNHLDNAPQIQKPHEEPNQTGDTAKPIAKDETPTIPKQQPVTPKAEVPTPEKVEDEIYKPEQLFEPGSRFNPKPNQPIISRKTSIKPQQQTFPEDFFRKSNNIFPAPESKLPPTPTPIPTPTSTHPDPQKQVVLHPKKPSSTAAKKPTVVVKPTIKQEQHQVPITPSVPEKHQTKPAPQTDKNLRQPLTPIETPVIQQELQSFMLYKNVVLVACTTIIVILVIARVVSCCCEGSAVPERKSSRRDEDRQILKGSETQILGGIPEAEGDFIEIQEDED